MGDEASETRKTTARSLQIVEALDELERARVSELAAHLDLAKSTVHTHLETLRANRYVVKTGDAYELGFRFYHLGERVKSREPIHDVVVPVAREVAGRSDEEVDYAVEEQGRIIVIYDEVANATQRGFQAGEYFHMHNTAAGKAMLAEYSRDRVAEVVDEWGLPRSTDATITDRDDLVDELDTVREAGYAVNDGESFTGIRAVAMTVHDCLGRTRGAVSISGPTHRLPANEVLADWLRPAIDRVEARIESERIA